MTSLLTPPPSVEEETQTLWLNDVVTFYFILQVAELYSKFLQCLSVMVHFQDILQSFGTKLVELVLVICGS